MLETMLKTSIRALIIILATVVSRLKPKLPILLGLAAMIKAQQLRDGFYRKPRTGRERRKRTESSTDKVASKED